MNTKGACSFPRRPSLRPSVLLLVVVIFVVVAGNQRLWSQVHAIVGWHTLAGVGTFASFFLFLGALLTAVLAPLTHRWVFKPAMVLLLLVVAVVAWFQDTYGTVIDRDIIRSALQTDALEAGELLTPGFALHMALYWLLPAALILITRPAHPRGMRFAARTGLVMLVSVVVLVSAVWAGYRNFSVLARDHSELRMMINPTYAMYSVATTVAADAGTTPVKLLPVAADAVPAPEHHGRPRVVVFVLGETARADHFQLNGYSRPTNPRLRARRIFNFADVSSCGTATAVSVPCIFSVFDRDSFDREDSRRYENLLHVLARTGVGVLWRENNTGCKGICEAFEVDSFRNGDDPRFCDGDGCVDEILLEGLGRRIRDSGDDLFIVLHQAGSHGPAYHRRYPERFRVFAPECVNDAPERCSERELTNSYDNSILYTDYFLSRVIDLLESVSSERDTAMLYVSDHGESLGENGIYLHGLPYAIAPRSQTHVPMVLWMSDDYPVGNDLTGACLREKRMAHLSHDNVFHTVLGLFDIHTRARLLDLDLLRSCQSGSLAAS